MASSGKSKMKQPSELAVNLVQILAELHQLSTASPQTSVSDNRTGSIGAPAMVIRGKQAATAPHLSAPAFQS